MKSKKYLTGTYSRTVLAAASLGTVALAWQLATTLHWVDPLFLPAPAQVLRQFWNVSQSGFMGATLWQHTAASLQRILLALAAAVAVGVPLGMVMGLVPWVRALIDPLVEICRPIPPLAYLPLLVIWCGIGELTKVLLIFLAMTAPIVIATTQGMSLPQRSRIQAARSLGASPLQIVRYVVLPAALPNILSGIRIGLGTGWSTLVAAELVAAKQGLGFMVQSAAQFLVTDIVILGIAVIAAVALLLEWLLRGLQRELTPWHGHES